MNYKLKAVKIRLNKISPENFMKSYKKYNNSKIINISNKKIEFNDNISCFNTISAKHNKNIIKYINNHNSHILRSTSGSNKTANILESFKTKPNSNTGKYLNTKKLNYKYITDENSKINYSNNKIIFMDSAENKCKNPNKINNNIIKKLNIISPSQINYKYQKLAKNKVKFNTSTTNTNTINFPNDEICNTNNFNLSKNSNRIKSRKITKKHISLNKENKKIIRYFHEKGRKRLNESNPCLSKIGIDNENNIFITGYSLENIKKDNFVSLTNQLNKLIKQTKNDLKIIDFLKGENWKLKEQIKDFLKNNVTESENLEFVSSLELENKKLLIENERLNMDILKLKSKINDFENEKNSQYNLSAFSINESDKENKELLQRIKNLEEKFYLYSKNKP